MTIETKERNETKNAFYNTPVELRAEIYPFAKPENQLDGSAIEIGSQWIDVGRQLLLFLPGSLLLYFATLSTLYFAGEFGFTFPIIFLMAAGAFMSYVGVGKLNELKNLVVPLTISGIAAIAAAVSSLFADPLQADLYFWYSIFLFPFALIAAKVAQKLMGSSGTEE